jgi:hypothetical protein
MSSQHPEDLPSFQQRSQVRQVIPMTLAQNSGADGTKVLNQLRQKHAAAGTEGRWWGVDCMNCTVDLALFADIQALRARIIRDIQGNTHSDLNSKW